MKKEQSLDFPDNIVCRTYAKERVQTLNNIAEGNVSALDIAEKDCRLLELRLQ